MKLLGFLTMLLFAAIASGCASTDAYFADRKRDAMDMFTFAAGKGIGATAIAGPVMGGMFLGQENWGIRCGEFNGITHDKGYSDPEAFGAILDPIVFPVPYEGGHFWFGFETCSGFQEVNVDGKTIPLSEARHKAGHSAALFPCVMIPNGGYQRLSEIDVAFGFGYTVRIGINPAEMIDFLLGWTTLDIFDDDIEAKICERKAEEVPKNGSLEEAGEGTHSK